MDSRSLRVMVLENDQSPSADFNPFGSRAARKLKHGALHRQPPSERMNPPDARHACCLLTCSAAQIQYSFRKPVAVSVAAVPPGRHLFRRRKRAQRNCCHTPQRSAPNLHFTLTQHRTSIRQKRLTNWEKIAGGL